MQVFLERAMGGKLYYGRPRTTQGIDLVIETNANRLNAFVAEARRHGKP